MSVCVCLSVCLPVCLPACLPACLCVCVCVCVCVYESVCICVNVCARGTPVHDGMCGAHIFTCENVHDGMCVCSIALRPLRHVQQSQRIAAACPTKPRRYHQHISSAFLSFLDSVFFFCRETSWTRTSSRLRLIRRRIANRFVYRDGRGRGKRHGKRGGGDGSLRQPRALVLLAELS